MKRKEDNEDFVETKTTKKRRKLEEEELDVEQPVDVKSDIVEEQFRDEGVDEEFRESIENLSGIKFVSAFSKNSKTLCKLFSSISKIDPSYTRNIQEKCEAVCAKYRADEKRDKFLRKLKTNISCEEDLFKTFLKYGMRDSENGNYGVCLIKMIRSIFEIGSDGGEILHPVMGIQMIVSHSKAVDIFLESHSLLKAKHLKGELPQVPIYSHVKAELLKLWLILLTGFTKISKAVGTENDKKILENSVPYLMQMYDSTLSSSDRTVFEIIKAYSSKKLGIMIETMPLFGPKCFDIPPPGAANPLYAHSTRANSVLGLINERKAFQTAVNYKEDSVDYTDSAEHYDLRFLLPLLCHALDEKNICNGALVVTNGWIYFIARGLALENKTLRSAAFLGYRRLILNFLTSRGFRLQDVKIWLHFLQSVKRGFTQLGVCKLSTVLSLWMVHTWEVIRQPSHLMYQRVTHFLLAKPSIELSILPEFVAFFNATDGNKESREWIMSVLASGLKSKADWKIAQKLPTVKFLCSSFLLEQAKIRKAILQILSCGAAIPEMAQEMVDKHSLPLWIANLSINDPTLKLELEKLFQNLYENSVHSSCRDNLFRFIALKHNWNLVTL